MYPHCSICLCFKPKENSTDANAGGFNNNNNNKITHKLPLNSEIIVSEMSFLKKLGRKGKFQSMSFTLNSNIDCLLKCQLCSLTVHQDCYVGGVGTLAAHASPGSLNWLCDPCSKAKSSERPYCCLCMLRGGALKQTDDTKNWVHVICALCIHGINFRSPHSRSILHIPSSLFIEETKHNACVYCGLFTRVLTKSPTGLTVKCNFADCHNRFHVTCGYLQSGCTFEQGDWPNSTIILCHEHARQNTKKVGAGFKLLLSIDHR